MHGRAGIHGVQCVSDGVHKVVQVPPCGAGLQVEHFACCRTGENKHKTQNTNTKQMHAAGGLFLKAQLFSNNLWAVNKRPFNTGKFGEDKKRLLNIFLTWESCDGILFRKHGYKIAADFNMPFESDEERQAVWDRVATLPTFRQAGEASAENVRFQDHFSPLPLQKDRETKRQSDRDERRIKP